MENWAILLIIGYFFLVTLVLVIFFTACKYEARKKREQELFDANEAGAKAFKEVFGKEPTGTNSKKK